MEDRADALQAAAVIISALEEIALHIGDNTVATVGRITSLPGQNNVVPGRVTFSLDIRNSDKTILDLRRQRQTDSYPWFSPGRPTLLKSEGLR